MNQTAFIPFNLPSIGEEETNEAIATLRSGWLTTGPRTDVHEGRRVLKVLQCCQEALGKAASAKTSDVQSQSPYFVHASTFLDDEEEIGEGTTIWHVPC